jgi:hypothetical protein
MPAAVSRALACGAVAKRGEAGRQVVRDDFEEVHGPPEIAQRIP